MAWHFYATRLMGDGTEVTIATELPLMGVQISKSLSAPDALSASIPVRVAHLQAEDGMPVFKPWHTAIYAVSDDIVHTACILTDVSMEDGALTLNATGFAGYMYDMPYDGDQQWINEDPLVIARHIWSHVQSFERGDIGLNLDATTSPVRIGTPVKQEIGPGDLHTMPNAGENAEDGNFEDGPYKLNWWSNTDVGKDFDDLAELTPFDYREDHEIVQGEPRHMLRLGYPTLGRRREDLRFVVGENVIENPRLDQDGADYASHVFVLGAGEGRAMVRGSAEWNNPYGLRKIKVIQDKSAQSNSKAKAVAKSELRMYRGTANVEEITVTNHPNALIGSWEVGDEILIQGSGNGWGGDLYKWFRILDYSISPDSNTCSLSVRRTERTV